MEKQQKFVDDWCVAQVLGEGAYGEVRLLVNNSNEAVACKIIDIEKHDEASDLVKKEILIHRLLKHPNVIQFLAHRKEPKKWFIFLEYASGGELFDRIEPDIGMPHNLAHDYMHQLLEGVEYLHGKGVAHRDIKPENLLIDAKGQLKISDFGMATMFRLKGVERLMTNRCGTLPYLAPEVLERPYKAEPADLWSCGIVLVAMLAGELPWDKPVEECSEFDSWKKNQYVTASPWNKLNNTALSLIKKLLAVDPGCRMTLPEIRRHHWMNSEMTEKDCVEDKEFDCPRPPKRLCSSTLADACMMSPRVVCLSQPAPRRPAPPTEQAADLVRDRDQISFSQPSHFDDLLVGSQVQMTQSPASSERVFTKFVQRMTRFFVSTDCEGTVKALCDALDKLAYTWNLDSSGMVGVLCMMLGNSINYYCSNFKKNKNNNNNYISSVMALGLKKSSSLGVQCLCNSRKITISTMDNRKTQLIIKANILSMDGKILVDFRLSKGCGLEFKRRFLQLKKSLSDILLSE